MLTLAKILQFQLFSILKNSEQIGILSKLTSDATKVATIYFIQNQCFLACIKLCIGNYLYL